MKVWLAAAAMAVTTACAAPPPVVMPAPAPPPIAPAPPLVQPPRADSCGASQLQHLVGRPRSEIPVSAHPNQHRVACTTCPVTRDYRPDRINFFFDAETGIIREVNCG
jgi:hypothetical protein